MMWSRRARTVVTVALSILGASPASGIEISAEEWALLPPWCEHTLTADSRRGPSRYQALLTRYGKDFSHMHHHCWGVVEEMRSLNPRLPAHQQRSYAESAMGDYDYVLRNTRPGFPFRLETLKRKATVLQRRGQISQAIAAGEQAIREFPAEPDGYIAAASAQIAARQRDLAERTLAAGLEQVAAPERIRAARDVLLGP